MLRLQSDSLIGKRWGRCLCDRDETKDNRGWEQRCRCPQPLQDTARFYDPPIRNSASGVYSAPEGFRTL